MEVLLFVVTDKSVKESLKNFLTENNDLYLEGRDIDTLFFNKKGDSKHEIYFHDYFDEVEDQFLNNYSKKEKRAIRRYFGSKEIFMFGIQYRDGYFLDELLHNFKMYLKKKGSDVQNSILLFHPFRGMIKW